MIATRFETLRKSEEAAAAATARKPLADPSVYDLAGLNEPQRKVLIKFWEAWQEVLKSLRILDPACGSGAFPQRPLIYNVAWKTAIYVLVSLAIHYLEHLVEFWRKTGGFVTGNEKLLATIVWPHFWAIQILLFVLILMYCTMHELVRVIGRRKVIQIFFGPLPVS